jgi:hypothetical protein
MRAVLRYQLSILAVVAAFWVENAAAEPQSDPLPPGYWPVEKSQPLIDKMAEISLAPDLSALSPGERIAVAKLLEVGQIFQTLYEQQLHAQALSSYRALQELDQKLASPKATQNLLTLYRLNQGPIANTLENERAAFLPVDLPPPGKQFFPWGITKEEVEAFVAACPEQRAFLLDPRALVRRADGENLTRDLGKLKEYQVLATLHPGLQEQLEQLAASPDAKLLYAVPYSVAYADEFIRAFGLLNEGASAVESDDVEFARYLRNRARDLLSDDYESGDASWVTGRFKNLNAEIGAYETYDDELYGTKASLGLSLLLLRKAETENIRTAVGNLQALEDALPYEHHKKVRENIPVGLYDIIADFGQARGGNTASVLPNENYLAERYGRTIVLRNNVIRDPKLFDTIKGGWDAVMAPSHKDELTPDGEFYDTLWHEVGHYLGVNTTKAGASLDDALQEDSSVLEEMKADLASLLSGEALEREGYYTEAGLREHYAAGINRVLLRNRPRRDQPYGTMQLIQWNFFLEQGLMRFDPATATLSIDYGRYREVVGKLLAQVLELQYQGDKPAADRFIEQYTVWDDNLHGKIARKLRDTATYRYWLFDYEALPN